MIDFHFRPARPDDGQHFWSMVEEIGTLERNTSYCYLLMAKMFSATCSVAEKDGERVGFVVGFRPPDRPESVFVWQIGVAEGMRGAGLATGLLLQLLGQTGARYLEATVGVSNGPSRALFAGFARQMQTQCQVEPCFLAEHFPGGDHEPEQLFRIGPLALDSEAYEALASRYGTGLARPLVEVKA